MRNIVRDVERLGLSPKEAGVYVALLELGQSTVSSIAERAGVNRSTTYLILRALRADGLVLELPNTKKHEFVAVNPTALVERMAERYARAEQLLPLLSARWKKDSGLSNVRFYQSVTGLRDAYVYKSETLKGVECVAFFGTGTLPAGAHEIVKKWYRQSKQLGVTVRAIAPDDTTLSQYRELDSAYDRDVRVVSQTAFPSEVSIEVFPAMVRMIALSDLQTIVIESESVATSFRAIFEMCWAQAGQSSK
jgi:HTH-type transcriptional regulator, sugar sensing transcriptional regulator